MQPTEAVTLGTSLPPPCLPSLLLLIPFPELEKREPKWKCGREDCCGLVMAEQRMAWRQVKGAPLGPIHMLRDMGLTWEMLLELYYFKLQVRHLHV